RIIRRLGFDYGLREGGSLHTELQVRRIQYGSKGIIDIFGAGKSIEIIFDFMKMLIGIYTDRRKRELENNLAEQEVIRKKLENATRFVELAEKLKGSDENVRKIVLAVHEAQEPLAELVSKGNITDVSLREEFVGNEKRP
ncbi:MAG: hypothetical protein NTV51_11650, partial [Verrucomicrobia bacterium]|nr:hypothetical protein [Verrucomicrobiota bacterium]